MDNDTDKTLTRGSLLQKLALAPIAIGALALLRTQEAEAAASMDPKAAGYVTHAVSGKKCSGCSLFIPGQIEPDQERRRLPNRQRQDPADGLLQPVRPQELTRSGVIAPRIDQKEPVP